MQQKTNITATINAPTINSPASSASIDLQIPMNLGGERLDIALQTMLPEHSRSRIQAWIK
jgi:hypothetical protein